MGDRAQDTRENPGAKDQILAGSGESTVPESMLDRVQKGSGGPPQDLKDASSQMGERQSEVLAGDTPDIYTARPIPPDVGTESDPGEKAARGQASSAVAESQDALA